MDIIREDRTPYNPNIIPKDFKLKKQKLQPKPEIIDLLRCDITHGSNPIYNDAIKRGMFKGWK